MNKKELRAQMIRKDCTVNDICTALEISRSAWFRKMRGTSQFTQGEICTIRSVLNLDDHQTAEIFFAENVS